MSHNSVGIPVWKKILIGVLILADLALLVVGIITIPPHFKETESVVKSPQTVQSNFPDGEDRVVSNSEERELLEENSQSSESNPPEASDPLEARSPSETSDLPTESNSTAEITVLSTDERPNLEDFLWYTEGVFYDGIPAEAADVAEIDTVTGGWKALIIYDPDNVHNSSAMEFLNLSISGVEDSVSLTLDWYRIFWSGEGESYDETDMEDSVFKGKWENDSLWASGAGTIRLTNFYTQNDKQYAIGTMDTPDGIPAYIALVRP